MPKTQSTVPIQKPKLFYSPSQQRMEEFVYNVRFQNSQIKEYVYHLQRFLNEMTEKQIRSKVANIHRKALETDKLLDGFCQKSDFKFVEELFDITPKQEGTTCN